MSRLEKQQDLVCPLPLNRVRSQVLGKDNLIQKSSCLGIDGAQNYEDVANQGELSPKSHPH